MMCLMIKHQNPLPRRSWKCVIPSPTEYSQDYSLLEPLSRKINLIKHQFLLFQLLENWREFLKLKTLEKIQSALCEQTSDLNESEFPIQTGRQLLERYFSQVKYEFPNDWENVDSLLMCAKYIGAFIKLLETFIIEDELTIQEMREELREIKQNILQKYSKGRIDGQQPVFAPGAFHSYTDEEGVEVNKPLLSKKAGSIEQIYKLLNESRQNNV